MKYISPTLCHQRKLLTAIYIVHDEPSKQNWEALLVAANVINQLAIDELSQLKAELAELTSSVMKLSLPLNAGGEKETMQILSELNVAIEDRTQSFIELNEIRLDAQQEAERAR